MPNPLAVDREAVKAHAITHGVREAARAFELPEDTVKSWSRREGWLAKAGQVTVVQPLPKSMQPVAPSAPKTPSQAAIYSVEKPKARSRFRMAKALDKAALSASKKDGDTLFAQAQQLTALATAHAKLFPPDNSGQSQALVQIALMSAPPVEHEPGATQGAVEH